MAKTRFRLYNTTHHETIALVELDDELLKPEANFIDQNTLTFKNVKHGGVYTIVPVDDPTVVTLLRLKQVYTEISTAPAGVPSAFLGRMDALYEAVGWLFGDVEYIVVENSDDIDKLINPPKGEYEPKKVKHTILGELLTAALKDLEEQKVKADETEEVGNG